MIISILATSAQALALDAGVAEAHASRGLALSLAQRHEEAMAEFERAIQLDPNSSEAHYFYGRACFAQNSLKQAAAFFERAGELKRAERELTLHPENPRPAYMGASCLVELGELDRVGSKSTQTSMGSAASLAIRRYWS